MLRPMITARPATIRVLRMAKVSIQKTSCPWDVRAENVGKRRCDVARHGPADIGRIGRDEGQHDQHEDEQQDDRADPKRWAEAQQISGTMFSLKAIIGSGRAGRTADS